MVRNTSSGEVSYPFGATENSGILRCCLSSPYSGLATLYGSDGTAYRMSRVKFNPNGYLNEFKMIFRDKYREIINLTTGENEAIYTQSEYSMKNNLYLFAQNYNGEVRYAGERIICSFKYYDKNNNLICKLIPCYRKSDKVIGMYDVIRNIFLTNSGNYTFAVGKSINLSVPNQVPISIDANSNIFNTTGYKDGYRVRSVGVEVENAGTSCTGFIPFKKGETLEIFPAFYGGNADNAINFFDENFNCLGQATDDSTYYGICIEGSDTGESIYKTTKVNGTSTLTLTDKHDSNIAYVRITHNIINSNSSIISGDGLLVTVTKNTNFADPASADWQIGYRLTSDAFHTTTSSGSIVTNFVNVQKDDIVIVEGIDFTHASNRQTFSYNDSPIGIGTVATWDTETQHDTIDDIEYNTKSLKFRVTYDDSTRPVIQARFSGLMSADSVEDVKITIIRNGKAL